MIEHKQDFDCIISSLDYTMYSINRIGFFIYNVTETYVYRYQLGRLCTSINYGQTFVDRYNFPSGQDFLPGCLDLSSDGTKIIAAVYGLGKLN